MDGKDNRIRVLAFTSCGHCPLSIVKSKGKCQPMKVYCPLQRDQSGYHRLVFITTYISELDPNCPLQSLEDLNEQLEPMSEDERVKEVEHMSRIVGTLQSGSIWSLTSGDIELALPNMPEKVKRQLLGNKVS